MKKLLAGTVVLAVAIGIAWPASGASTASIAKKALALATKANKTAGQAKKAAGQANQTAGQALTAAEQGPATVQINSGDVSAAPNDFAEFDVKCPSGYAATGFGPGLGALELVVAFPTTDGYIASYFNPSTSSSYKGNLYVVCVRGTWRYSPKRVSRTVAVRRMEQLEKDRLSRAR
jgi:hypothetical protein